MRIACRGGWIAVVVLSSFATGFAQATAPAPNDAAKGVQDHYMKWERSIPMRDGVKLFTSIYLPRDSSEKHAILLKRTPYSCKPYGEDQFSDSPGPSTFFLSGHYVLVSQDVRGCYMSEGVFDNMRPHRDLKSTPQEIDESSDTYDTVDWLVKNVPDNNGRVGLYGISYPGFYASAGMIDAHPALKAVSPQAPIADWFFDDFHHHGAFFLPHAFNFLSSFGQVRQGLVKEAGKRFEHGTPDGYQFFLEMGPLSNADAKYFHGAIPYWNQLAAHPNYDAYWQARNLLPHLHKVVPAVMTVGGWFDAEDLYGALQTYRAVERLNPGIFNMLVMGPWQHGGWSRTDGDKLGRARFGAKTSLFYREQVELRFFDFFLRDVGTNNLPEAEVFETGANRWRQFPQWPPAGSKARQLFLQSGGRLAFDAPPVEGNAFDEFTSDPARPVPFTEDVATGMTREYMTDDQRFAERRPDVLSYTTSALDADVTLAGPMFADLWVSTSQQDADWVVKLIDVFPPDAKWKETDQPELAIGNYHMMVRSEVLRGRFRDSYSDPKPFTRDQPTRLHLVLQDVLHTFQKGHRIQVQVQSTWFPLVDRNPQKWVDNLFQARAEDFVKASHRVWRDAKHESLLEVNLLPAASAQ